MGVIYARVDGMVSRSLERPTKGSCQSVSLTVDCVECSLPFFICLC
ncbi:hypothetical protein SLEP1_g57301 [Rubroshorea leprosula]|uniref:Uncharacterized protein n=1 Tax=Rubroshorea leprosula TaxID=152421 RepID=A0AAV5MP36_9ROSI|nr:hypothetical protein SLEP1_g57301 [Rubroshorea leprosula]